jgi:uncharacterized protein
MEQGRAHEAAVVGDVGAVRVTYPPGDLEAGFGATRQAMCEGWPVIHQGVLVHDDMAGIPDILERVDEPSVLGEWHYRPVDVKLGSSLKNEYTLQVAMYMRLLKGVQGVMPSSGRVILKDKSEVEILFDEQLFSEMMYDVRALAGGKEAKPFISSACGDCEWSSSCLEIAEASQDISLISGLQRRAWQGLRERGIGELSALAKADPADLLDIPGIGEKTAQRITLQAETQLSGEMIQIQPTQLPSSSIEIFFDVESVPTLELDYLMGIVVREGEMTRFEYELALSQVDESNMWGSFLDRISAFKGPVFHYANYERQVVARLNNRYGPDPRANSLLERMVDVERVLKNSVILPLRGTSLKIVAPWLGYEWSGPTTGGGDSMVEYLQFLEDGDDVHIQNILAYNERDCHATLMIRDWLETPTLPERQGV